MKRLLLAITVTVFAIMGCIGIIKTAASTRDNISPRLRRFEEVNKHLKSAGTVGYVTEKFRIPTFYFTQFAVAPVVVLKDPDMELVIGNFKSSSRFYKLPIREDYVVIRDFDNGLLLLRKKSK